MIKILLLNWATGGGQAEVHRGCEGKFLQGCSQGHGKGCGAKEGHQVGYSGDPDFDQKSFKIATLQDADIGAVRGEGPNLQAHGHVQLLRGYRV